LYCYKVSSKPRVFPKKKAGLFCHNKPINTANRSKQMNQTYTIASEQGNIAITRRDAHANGHVVEFKEVAMRDGSYVGFSRNSIKPNWVKCTWGKMAAKRFQWAKAAADQYFAN
jgi:hypothetical protein